MAANMENIVKFTFPMAKMVADRFHVQKLAYEAVQEIRIKYRWEAIDQENQEIAQGREVKQKYVPRYWITEIP